MNKYYTIPEEFKYRIHHVRPRFKRDVENVLLFMAEESSKIKTCSCKQYSSAFNAAIRLYPGNESVKQKTINNWRTEISSLFAFYIEDKDVKLTKTGEMAKLLATHQDLVQFFKHFLFTFQYPGGHLKKEEVLSLINHGVKFKPAQYIINLLVCGNQKFVDTGKLFGISKAEATHCIFNDLRVTRDNRDPEDVIELILENRKNKIKYDSKGDVIRYAGDILDYMVIANLLKESHGYYYLNGQEPEATSAFLFDKRYFKEYDKFYGRETQLAELDGMRPVWFKYVNDRIDPNVFATNIASYIQSQDSSSLYTQLIKDKIKEIFDAETANTKEIGDLGEALVVGHEKVRISDCGLKDKIHLVVKIPTALGVGYDIQSLEGSPDLAKRYIEVKTTISRKEINIFKVHLTPNEWGSAETMRAHYYIYRLMISSTSLNLFLLKDPVTLYKTEKINMIPADGAELSFSREVCEQETLKIWQGN